MTETTEMLSLGQQLKNAREAQNLSLEDIVHKTNLKKSHLESLENDIFILPNVPPAFVRGYVRSYLRYLRLPESLVNHANYGEVTIPKEVKRAAPIPVSNSHKSQSRWVKWLTGFILFCAIGMTLAWWWQEHKKEEVRRDSLVNSVEIASHSREHSANTVSVAETPVVQNDVSVTVSSSNDDVSTAAVESTPMVEVQTDNTANDVTQTVENSISAPQFATETPAAVGDDELRIEVVGGQSWIAVRSTKSKKNLAEKLYNTGDVLTFNNNEQYRLTIGAPAYVKVYYKGQHVPMKVNGRVARFNLPQ